MRRHGLPGTFFVIDGGEGTGKSAQIRRLRERLPELYPQREFVFSREPGGTPFADDVYALARRGMTETNPRTLFCLMFGSRFDHVEKLILPALMRGAVVVLDRFEGSTDAYQIFAQQAEELHALFYCSQQLVPSPDATCILEVPVDVALARLAARKGQQASAFDLAAREFHERVARGFRQYAKLHAGHPCFFVDGNRAEEIVHEDLLRRFASVLA